MLQFINNQMEDLPIICFGDSITQGNEECGYWTNELQTKLDQWDANKYLVINKGVSGNTSAQGFDRLPNDVIPLMPGIVLLEFGINDSNYRPWAEVPRVGLEEYKKNLREFSRVITSRGGLCIFIVNHVVYGKNAEGEVIEKYIQGNGKAMEENQKPYNDAVKYIAMQLSAPIIDLPQIIESRKIIHKEFLGKDGIHLSSFGSEIYAEILFERLKSILGKKK